MNRRLVSFCVVTALTSFSSPALLMSAAISASAAGTPCAASTFAMGQAGGAIVNGQLYTWGRNYEGELGQGPTAPVILGTPTPVPSSTGLSNVAGFWPGFQDAFATDASGHVWAWGGSNSSGERGNNNGNNIPQPVVGPTDVTSIGPGGSHTIVATRGGDMWGWGQPAALGLNGNFPVNPTQLSGPPNVVKVAAGDVFSLVLVGNGTLYAAGSNFNGQLGLGQGVSGTSTFTAIPGLASVVDMAAGSGGGTAGEFSVVVDTTGHVYAFGGNFYGQMGNGTASSSPQFTPTQIQGLDHVVQVGAGLGFAVALQDDGTVWAWGYNGGGALGNNSLTNSSTPVRAQFPSGVQIVRLAAGWSDSMALDSNGHVWVWGYNGDGEVGNGFILAPPVTTPTQINLGPVVAGCSATPLPYLPSRDGYQFNNSGPFNFPDYNLMAAYYPASRDKMYNASGGHSKVGAWFYDNMFLPAYKAGLCYGMATSSTFLFNRATPPPGTFNQWNSLGDPFGGDTLTPPVLTGDPTIERFIDRYHARQYAALGAASSTAVWAAVGHDTGPGFTYDRTFGNLGAFDVIAARVKTNPLVVAFGPSPYIATGGPALIPNPIPGLPPIPYPLPDPVRFKTLFDNSHAVVAYATLVQPNGTRVIRVYDPSSSGDAARTDQSRIEMAPDGSVKLIDFAGGADKDGNPKAWIGGGKDSDNRDMGQPGDWILMPLPDVAFSDDGSVLGQDNHHWVIPDAVAIAINSNAPWKVNGPIVFHFSAPGSGTLAETLAAGAAYDSTVTAMDSQAFTAVASSGHLAVATQTDSAAAGSSHHILVDPTATSIQLDSGTQPETFSLELAGDYLPAYSRDIVLSGFVLAPNSNVSVASDQQTSGVTVSSSAATASTLATTFTEAGANAGSATVQVTIPGGSVPGVVSIFDWNNLGTSLIYEVVDPQGTPSGLVLQGNAGQVQQQIAQDLALMQATIAGIADPDFRASLQSKLDSARNSINRGQPTPAANSLRAIRNQVDAQVGKQISAADAKTLRDLTADALVLLASS